MRALVKVSALVHMSRPWNWLRMQVPATILGMLLGLYCSGCQYSNVLDKIPEVVISVASISAGGYIINDYFDKDIDAVNEPHRPIPSGKIGEKLALTVSILFFGSFLVALELS